MKHAFLTGAGRGLGKGFVNYLTDQGFFVFAGVREIKKDFENKENLEYVICDLSNDKSIEDCAKLISSKTDHLDIIVNNAGVNKDSVTNGHKEKVSLLKDLERTYLLDMFDVNSISPMIVIQKLIHLLKSDPSFIVNISSCRASTHDEFEAGYPNYGYSGSKSALNMFTYRLSKELPKNIKTFTVHPGSVQTDMNKHGDQLPYDQAEKIIEITKNWNDNFNGKFMNWDGTEYPL